MSIIGIGKGLVKVVTGVVTQDGEKILKGVYQTGAGVVGTVVTTVVNEEVGQAISQHSEDIDD